MKSGLIPMSIIIISLLAACSSGGEATEAPLATEEPTQELITETPVPTSTPEPSPTPDPIIFLDEFEGSLAEGWEWLNEDPGRWSITEQGWLAVTAANPGMGASEEEYAMVNLLTYPLPEGDFVVTTRVVADPSENFKQATLFLLAEPVNYVAVLTGFCDLCLPESGGYGVFMEAYRSGENLFQEPPFIEREAGVTDLYLRLVYSEAQNTVTGYYAIEADNWQRAFVVVDPPDFQRVALGAGNLPGPDGSSYDLQAYFDYLQIARVETPVIVNPQLPQPVPTEELPTVTPLPSPTALPEGILFRDDFEGTLQPGWEWYNEDPERWEFVEFAGEKWLQLTGGQGRTNFLLREAPQGSFMITAHIIADPSENFHQANIGVYEDFDNYIVLNIGFCGPCVEGGEGFYMETFIENNPFENAYKIPRDPELKDVYLRLVVEQGGSITSYYATPSDPDNWIKLGAFGNYFDFLQVGIGAANFGEKGEVQEDIVALYDWFEIAVIK